MNPTDRLWAPWRLEYIQKSAGKQKSTLAKDCVFCKELLQGPSLESLILFKDIDVFVILNKFPYNPYHLMVLPVLHTGDPTDLDHHVWVKWQKAILECTRIIKEVVSPQGFNIGMNIGEAGGAGIAPHLHTHILPRWQGDTNFMPLIAETKALPIHNETIYNALLPKFEHFADCLR